MQLYSKMLAGEISDINDQQQDPEIKRDCRIAYGWEEFLL